MMYVMHSNNVISLDEEKVIAKVKATVLDLRDMKYEYKDMTLYIELTAEDQEPKPIVERVLTKLGYSLVGIIDCQTTSIPENAEQDFAAGVELNGY